MAISITDVMAASGFVTGVIGCVLSILNYLNSQKNILVSLNWDMAPLDGKDYNGEKAFGIIHVTNCGVHAIYVSHVHLIPPKGYDVAFMVVKAGIEGITLKQGDPPRQVMVSQKGLEKFAANWKGVRAAVVDSTGKVWYSKRLKKPPSWAKAEVAAAAAAAEHEDFD